MSKYVKKLFFVLSFLLFCNSTFGQNYTDSLNFYYQKKDFRKAIQFCEQIIQDYHKQDIINDKLYYSNIHGWLGVLNEEISEFKIAEMNYLKSIDILNEDKNYQIEIANVKSRLGYFYLLQNDFKNAEKYLISSKDIYLKSEGTNGQNYLKISLALGKCHYSLGNLDAANKIYENIYKTTFNILDEYSQATFFNDYSLVLEKKYDYKKAEDLLNKALVIEKKILGENSKEYLVISNHLAIVYLYQGKYKLSEKLFLEVIKNNKLNSDVESEQYINSLGSLASLYIEVSKYNDAEKLFNESIEIQKKNNLLNTKSFLLSRSGLAKIYKIKNKLSEAESIFIENTEKAKNILGASHPDYPIFLADLASFYEYNYEYSKSEKLFLETLEIQKNTIGENNPLIATTLTNLSTVYIKQKKYQLAEPLILKSIQLLKEYFGDYHPDYFNSISILADLYYREGKFSESESLCKIAINSFKKGSNIDCQQYYLNSIITLANIYYSKENYSEAEKLYLEVIKIYRDDFNYIGERNFTSCLINLSNLYIEIGSLEKAKKNIIEAIEIEKTKFGETHQRYASALHTLGVLYEKEQNFEKAEQAFLKVIEIDKNTLDENNPDYATSIYSLARIYNRNLNYREAEILYLKVIEIRKKVLGEVHPDYFQSIASLASLYYNYGKYEESERLFLQSIEGNKKNNGPTNYTRLNNLAILYFNWDKPNFANSYFEKCFIPFQNQIVSASTYLSENELNFFRLDKFSNRFLSLSFLHRYPTPYPNINTGCYENELLVKNLSLRNQQRIAKSIHKSGDTILQNKYDEFLHNKRQLGKLNELPLNQRPSHYEQLTSETEMLEKELVRSSSAFAEAKNALSVNWKQVQEKLQPNEIAIDLVAFNYYNKKWTDSIVYSAFVVGKGYKTPKYIPLFEQKQLELLIKRNSKDQDTVQVKKLNKQYSGKEVSDLFLKPLAKELENITRIYLAPSGLGNQIDFSALPVSDTQTLGEKYQVHILGSTAEIVNYKPAHFDKKTNLELLLYGGIDYNKTETTTIVENDSLENKSDKEFNALATRSGISKWNYLAGTRREIEQVQASSKQYGFISTIINGSEATEESIKQLDGRIAPYVLHLATHGFFFPDPQKELPQNKETLLEENNNGINRSTVYKISEDPMMRSGLLFAGANKYWAKPADNIKNDDGILTASEISNLDLSACQLVVLSACETGLGDIQGSEGVFGLQRAFKMAGVKNIIMSLWKVPDVQTAELFDVFYRECFAGKTIHDAFQSAQAKMKSKYSPFYWAGFVLLE